MSLPSVITFVAYLFNCDELTLLFSHPSDFDVIVFQHLITLPNCHAYFAHYSRNSGGFVLYIHDRFFSHCKADQSFQDFIDIFN